MVDDGLAVDGDGIKADRVVVSFGLKPAPPGAGGDRLPERTGREAVLREARGERRAAAFAPSAWNEGAPTVRPM